jgi:DNA polymerase I
VNKPLLVLFDGNALIHRAFHALPPLTVSRTGEMVGAVYGFAQMLLRVLNDLRPSHCAVAFDMKAPTFRHQLFEQYKAQRPPTPEELVDQIGRVRGLVAAFRIPIFELEGFEADDLLGTLCRQAGEAGMDSVIVTGDADAMQLVSDSVRVLYPKPGKSFGDTMLYDREAVLAKYGLGPEHIADLKGLEGDTSDNIPGVPGIGRKTAVKLIQQFGTMDQIYDHINEVAPARLQTILKENEAVGRQSRALATIDTRAPVTLQPEECRLSQYDRTGVAELFRELEFFTLLPRLPEIDTSREGAPTSGAVPPRESYHAIREAAEFDGLIERLSSAVSFAFDLETTGLDPLSAGLVGLSFSLAPGEAFYIPVGHTGLEAAPQLPLEVVLTRVRAIMADGKTAKVTHNGKYDTAVLRRYGCTVANLAFDTMLAAYLLGEKALSLKALGFARLGIEMTPITDLIGTGAKQVPMSQVDIARAAPYACADADVTGRLATVLEPELRRQGLWPLFADVEMPLLPVLARMESHGIALDPGILQRMSERLNEQLRRLEADIYNAAGHQFNINSPQQLGTVLFDDLKLAPAHQTRNRSTGAAILEELRGAHPIVDLILDYRQLSKIKSTYIDALLSLIDPATGRLHTSFNQTRTTTGRLSSSEPNLQNIPVRGELAKEVRRAFVAPEGSYLLAGDYSQIDLRVLAHISQDRALLEAFRRDEDIHTATAALVFGVTPSAVTPDMRRVAKTVNFGVIYGMSEYGLEQATELSREESARFIAAYFKRYPGVMRYIEATKEQARRQGYVLTILGRRRAIPEINAANRQIREAAERMAINMPVQGTSADIIKIAMINIDREMDRLQLKSKMLLQVHDELIFEVPGAEMETMRRLVPRVMSSALLLSVPLKVDVKSGYNWGEMEQDHA